jgi:hypothetical protein|tara:strand:+ start:1419 stop:1754 length:336 start_codon:yes stop_codon:yes gene_type:complete
MNTLDIINNQLDDIEIARLDAQERMHKGEARRAILQDAFNRSVLRAENIDLAGNVNWNFVDADLHLDGLEPTQGEFSTMVSRWEDKDLARIEIAFRNSEAKLEEIETGFFK